MAGRIKISFHIKVFITLLALCWILVGTFMMFQYQREKYFRTSMLDAQLQMHNDRITDDMSHGEPIADVVARIGVPIEGLRVTLIDSSGQVTYDSNDATPFPTANHNDRREILMARAHGQGHAVERWSQSDDISYFYSARLADGGLVIRSAVPYTHNLVSFLKADSTLLWIMTGMTLVMSLIGFLATRKISTTICRLNRFAEKAERGEHIYNDEAFPDDELGSIASNIVKLYAQREEQNREAIRTEQDKTRLKRQLTQNINHELKTPVASILVSLELLDDHPELDEHKKQKFMGHIRENALRLNALLKDISTITRMDEGSGMIEKSTVDLTALISDIIAEQQLRTDMKINLRIPQLEISGNYQLLESIFRNIIDNAIIYSGATEMNICADNEGNFHISDNGCGISEPHISHIFERFYRVDKGRSRASGGTGLGLSIVRHAIAFHGGDIKAVSLNGLTLLFRLKVNQNAT